MGAFVYLEVLGAGEHLAASLERARERFLPRVHAYVIDQLVLGLERAALALAAVPEARVRRALRPADVLDRDVRHDVLHGSEHLAARAQRRRARLVDPQARHVLERGAGRGRGAVPHVPVKRAGRVVAAAAVRVLGAIGRRVVVPVHWAARGRRLQRQRLRRRRRRWRRRRVHLIVMVVVVVVQLQVVRVHGRVQAAQMVLRHGAVLQVVVARGRVMVPVHDHVPAYLLQEVAWPRVPRMVRRLPVVRHVMVLVRRRGRRHVIVLDLDAHTVGQRRVVFHKRI